MHPMISFILVLALAVTAWGAPNNCSIQYQAALQQVLDLKDTCSEAVYKDCAVKLSIRTAVRWANSNHMHNLS